MTLVEVLFAVGVLTIALGGILATFLQSRRLTEGSVYQNAALTIIQGYIEQMKNMDMGQLLGSTDANGNAVLVTTSYSIPVYYDKNTLDALKTSTGTPPSFTSINNGVTPSGVQDNLKSFDMAKDLDAVDMANVDDLSYATTAQVTWPTAWPGALDYSTANPSAGAGNSSLKLNVWVWVKDVSVAAQRSNKIYSITMIYTWAYKDGGRVRYVTDAVQCMRSAVMTY